MRLAAPAAVGLLVLAHSAAAQQKPESFDLKGLSGAEVVLVARGLAKLPYEDVAALLNKLQAQFDEQTKAAEEKK